MLEGLQIEEEGLTDCIRKKTKQDATLPNSASFNEPLENSISVKSAEKKQILKSFSTLNANYDKTNTQKIESIRYNTTENDMNSGSIDSSKTKKYNSSPTVTSKSKEIHQQFQIR